METALQKRRGTELFEEKIGFVGMCQFLRLLGKAKDTRTVSIDIETTGLSQQYDQLVGISLCVKSGRRYIALYMPYGHKTVAKQENLERKDFEYFFERMMDRIQELVFHNSPFDLPFLKRELGLTLNGHKLRDVLYLNNLMFPFRTAEGRRNNLKSLTEEYLGEEQPTFEETFGGGKIYSRPAEAAAYYAQFDAYATLRIYEKLRGQLPKKEPIKKLLLYYDLIESENLITAMDLNAHGIPFNLQESLTLERWWADKQAKFAFEFQRLCKKKVDIDSAQQLKGLFFAKDGYWHLLPTTRTEKGDISFGKSSLAAILEGNHQMLSAGPDRFGNLKEVFDRLAKYRFVANNQRKVVSFIDEAETSAAKRSGEEWSRIYGHWRGNTINGRFSCTGPTLQSISRHSGIKRVIQAQPKMTLVGGDFSQIDFRSLAAYCSSWLGRDDLTNKFKNDEDLHWSMAKQMHSKIFDGLRDRQKKLIEATRVVKVEGKTKNALSATLDRFKGTSIQLHDSCFDLVKKAEGERESMKRINYGLIYMMSAKGLANKMNEDSEVDNEMIADAINNEREIDWDTLIKQGEYSIEEAEKAQEEYFNTFPVIKECIDQCEALWRTNKGYVLNLFGRPVATPILSGLRMFEPGQVVRVHYKGKTGTFRLTISIRSVEIKSLRGRLDAVEYLHLPPGRDPEKFSNYVVERNVFIRKGKSYLCDQEFQDELVHLKDQDEVFPIVSVPHRLISAMSGKDAKWISYSGYQRGKRQIFSGLIGSTSMDICKIAMILARKVIDARYRKDKPKLILCVHDEVIYEVREEIADEFKSMLSEIMSFKHSICTSNRIYGELTERILCPIRATMKMGKVYGEMKEDKN